MTDNGSSPTNLKGCDKIDGARPTRSPEQRSFMTISITLTPDQERTLEELARHHGKDPSVYVSDMVTAYLNGVRSEGGENLRGDPGSHLGRLATECPDGG